MSRSNGLGLHEEIMLLVLKDEEGTVHFGASYQYALAGAVLAELLLQNRARVVGTGKKKMLEVADATPVGDAVVDECLDRLATAKRRGSPQTWVSKFAGTKNLKHRVAESLCERGVLRADKDKVLLIFSRRVYPELDPQPERELNERLRQAIFTDTDEVEPRTAVLLSLARGADLLKFVFDRKELKPRKDRIEAVVNGEITGKATREAIQAMQAAVMVACIVPTIVTTTMTH